MPLTDRQLEQYRSEGYAAGGRILDDRQLERLRAEIDTMISELPPGQRPENMPSLHYRNRYLLELLLSDPLVDVAEQILGPDVSLFTVYIISKRPEDGLAVDWHQDAPFFPIDPMATFTLWLAVDDSDRENGCMCVVPGSHRERVVYRHRVNLDGGTTLPLLLRDEDVANPAHVELRAGEYSVHDPFILHGSSPNTSARRRCGITIKYIANDVSIDRTFVSPSGFDWKNLRLFPARGNAGRANQFHGV